MYVIVGLGNPGRRFAHTRHNMGFMAVEQIAEDMGIKITKKEFEAKVGEGFFSGQKVLLAKPQTYMNLSGKSIVRIRDYFDVPEENLIIVYDDIDIPTGTIRIRKKGGPGTHNGMRSIVSELGNGGFPRIRIGTGGDIDYDLKDYVMGKVSKEEKELVDSTIDRAAKAAEAIIEDGIDRAMNRFNGNS